MNKLGQFCWSTNSIKKSAHPLLPLNDDIYIK